MDVIKSDSSKLDRVRYSAFLIWSIIGGLALLYVAGFVLGQVMSAVSIVLVSALLVFLMHAPVQFFEDRGIPRTLGTLITFIVAGAIVGVIGTIIVPVFGKQVSAFIMAVPEYVDEATAWINSVWNQYGYMLSDSSVNKYLNDVGSALSNWALSATGSSASGIISFGTSLGGTIVSAVMSFVVTFWILKDLPRLRKEIIVLVGPRREDDFKLLESIIVRVMGGYVKGTLISSMCTGILAGIGFSIIGVPYAGVLGLITGVLNIIPYVGPWIGGVIAAVVGLFVSPLAALLSLVVTLVAQQFTDTFISPRVMSSTVELHPALVIIALTAGGSIGGIVGMIVAVPITAAAKAIFVYYFEKKTKRRLASEDGVIFMGGMNGDNGKS